MMTKLKTGAWVVILVGTVAFTFWQRQQIKRLVGERAVLYDQVGRAASQRDEIERLTAQLRTTAEGSEADRDELMQLRAQSVRLRQVEQENSQLKIERQSLTNQLSQAKRSEALQQKKLSPPQVTITSLPPGVTDLGMVVILDGTSMRLELGSGKECILTVTGLNDGLIEMLFDSEVEIPGGFMTHQEQKVVTRPGQQIISTINGVEIALTPTLLKLTP